MVCNVSDEVDLRTNEEGIRQNNAGWLRKGPKITERSAPERNQAKNTKVTKITQTRTPRVQGTTPEYYNNLANWRGWRSCSIYTGCDYRWGAAGECYQVSEGRCGVNSRKALCPGDWQVKWGIITCHFFPCLWPLEKYSFVSSISCLVSFKSNKKNLLHKRK